MAGWMHSKHRTMMLKEGDDGKLVSLLHGWLAEKESVTEGDFAFPPGPKALGEQLYGRD